MKNEWKRGRNMSQTEEWYQSTEEYETERMFLTRSLLFHYQDEKMLRTDKRKIFEIGKKADRSAAHRVIIPEAYLLRTAGAGRFLSFCVGLAITAMTDDVTAESLSEIAANRGMRVPTFGFAMQLFTGEGETRRDCFEEFFREKEKFELFFELDETRAVTEQGLVIRSRILQFLYSPETDAKELAGFCRLYHGRQLADKPLSVGKKIEEKIVSFLKREGESRILYLYGPGGSGKRFLLRHACRENGQFCLEADAGELTGERGKDCLPDVIREAILRRAVLCIRNFQNMFREEDLSDASAMLQKILCRLPMVVVLSDRKWTGGIGSFPAPAVELEIKAPETEERIALWREAFRRYPKAEPEIFRENERKLWGLAGKFSFLPGQIMEAAENCSEDSNGDREEALYQACREQVTHRLGERAMRIKPAYGWDDLILPPDRKAMLKDACNQIEFSHQVYGKWGFSTKMAYGRGVSMMFCGPPGTGKTMGAQVIARELHLELYKADLSSIMSKYIGETEKNLGALFDEVKKSQSILFFDEADAIFGKRSEVKDAQDKYANAETAYLLQKMEEYDGIVILATNYFQNFDEAFKRRIRFIIEFPLPDAERRLEIWQRVYPKETPVSSEVDFEYLASQFELSGSSIKNIAIAAAFKAAAAGTEVEMSQILGCLREEMKKSGKNLQRDDFGQYYDLIRD